MKKAGFIYDDVFLKHEAPHGHPERGGRLVSIVNTRRYGTSWCI